MVEQNTEKYKDKLSKTPICQTTFLIGTLHLMEGGKP